MLYYLWGCTVRILYMGWCAIKRAWLIHASLSRVGTSTRCCSEIRLSLTTTSRLLLRHFGQSPRSSYGVTKMTRGCSSKSLSLINIHVHLHVHIHIHVCILMYACTVYITVLIDDEFWYFSFFLEKNMQSFFLKILTQRCGRYVCLQLLQTLNILFENIRNETSICKYILLPSGMICIPLLWVPLWKIGLLNFHVHVHVHVRACP